MNDSMVHSIVCTHHYISFIFNKFAYDQTNSFLKLKFAEFCPTNKYILLQCNQFKKSPEMSHNREQSNVKIHFEQYEIAY